MPLRSGYLRPDDLIDLKGRINTRDAERKAFINCFIADICSHNVYAFVNIFIFRKECSIVDT